MNVQELSTEWLVAHGFRPEEGGFVRDKVTLKELSGLLGFSPNAVEGEPGRDPDEPRCTVEINGGRCTLDYTDPYAAINDPETVVAARVLVYKNETK